MWEGDCFVFDNRVSVNHNLEKGEYEQCFACRMPITEADQQSTAYIKGESCPHCIGKATDEQKALSVNVNTKCNWHKNVVKYISVVRSAPSLKNAKQLRLKPAVKLMPPIKPKPVKLIFFTYKTVFHKKEMLN